jgi:hypothetical protein
MYALIQILKNLFTRSAATADNRDDRYLAESADIYDLERRMRQLDTGRENLYALGTYGLFMR